MKRPLLKKKDIDKISNYIYSIGHLNMMLDDKKGDYKVQPHGYCNVEIRERIYKDIVNMDNLLQNIYRKDK